MRLRHFGLQRYCLLERIRRIAETSQPEVGKSKAVVRLRHVRIEFDRLLERLYRFAVLLQLEIRVTQIQINFRRAGFQLERLQVRLDRSGRVATVKTVSACEVEVVRE